MQLRDEKVALSLFLSFLLQVSWCIQVGWSYQKSHRNHGTFTSIWLILMVNVGKYTYLYGGSWADQWKQQNSNGNGMVGKYTSPMDPMEIWVVVLNILYFHPETWRRWTHFDKKNQTGWFNHQPEIGYIYVFSVFPQVTLTGFPWSQGSSFAQRDLCFGHCGARAAPRANHLAWMVQKSHSQPPGMYKTQRK